MAHSRACVIQGSRIDFAFPQTNHVTVSVCVCVSVTLSACIPVSSACMHCLIQLLTSVGNAFTSSCPSGIMVSKIDQCMLDLMRFHGEGEDPETREAGTAEQEPVATASATVTASSQSPKAADAERISAGSRLTSHRPQSPLSDSGNSADMSEPSQLSQSPVLSETPPLAKPSPKMPPSQVKSNDDRYL